VDLCGLLFAANRRYLDFIAAVDDPTNAMRDLDKLSRPVRKNDRGFRGFNLFPDPTWTFSGRSSMAAPTCRDFATGIFSKAFRSAAGRCRRCRDVFANTG
jgi:hypothetical protein